MPLAQMIQARDWAATPLGPLARWPASLRTAVDICVASRFPIVMYCGPEFTMLYNDAYVPFLGRKHPQALGQPCAQVWSEIWPTVGPMLSDVLITGAATFSEDMLMIVEQATRKRRTSPSPSARSRVTATRWGACSAPAARPPAGCWPSDAGSPCTGWA